MKKIVAVLMILMLLVGCEHKEYDRITVNGNDIELVSNDAEEVLSFLETTVKSHAGDLNVWHTQYGAVVTWLTVGINGKVTSYSVILDNLLVTADDGTTKKYRIDTEYYKREFYPYMSKLFDSYCPVIYQISFADPLLITCENSGTTRQIEKGDWLEDLAKETSSRWYEADSYIGSTDGYEYKIVVNDFTVKEELYVFNDYIVINGRLISIPGVLKAVKKAVDN